MRKVDCVLLVLVILLVSPFHRAIGQLATFSPPDPKFGDLVTVIYNPEAQGATILKPSSLSLQALLLCSSGVAAELLEIPMDRSGKVWRGSFTLDRKDARFLLYQFVSGNLKDDNVEKGWSGMALGPDGKELEGTRYWRGVVLAFGGHQGFKHRKDVNAAKADLSKERKTFPNNYFAANIAWYLETNPTPTDAGIARVKKELSGELNRFRNNEEALPMILVWLEQTGQQAKADSLRSIVISGNPKGKVAAAARMREFSKEQDPHKKTNLLEKYLSDFPQKEDELLANQRQLLLGFVQVGQYEKGYALLKSSPKLDVGLYRNVSSPMIEKGVTIDKAVEWLGEGVEIARKGREDARPPYVAKADWKRFQANTLAELLAARGVGLSKLGRNKEAEEVLEEAYGMKNGEDVVVNENLINVYVANSKFKEAEKLGLDCLRKAKSNLKIVEKFKIAFKSQHGSLASYDKTVQSAKMEEETSRMNSAINKPAPDFSLKDMNGAIVKLSGLRGKVVVLNFWATWSSSGKASLAHLQKAYEVYRDYRNVAFVSISTGESLTGSQREAAVKKVMEEGKLTFPVLYDAGKETIQTYEAEGIPTMFVIDRDGRIQFKSVGFVNGDEMVNELRTQVDVLLKH
jgi:peroxiredoxin